MNLQFFILQSLDAKNLSATMAVSASRFIKDFKTRGRPWGRQLDQNDLRSVERFGDKVGHTLLSDLIPTGNPGYKSVNCSEPKSGTPGIIKSFLNRKPRSGNTRMRYKSRTSQCPLFKLQASSCSPGAPRRSMHTVNRRCPKAKHMSVDARDLYIYIYTYTVGFFTLERFYQGVSHDILS